MCHSLLLIGILLATSGSRSNDFFSHNVSVSIVCLFTMHINIQKGTQINFVPNCRIAGTVGWLGVGLNALPVEISLLGVSFIVFISIQIVVVSLNKFTN